MWNILFILAVISFLLALLTAISAIRAGLKLRRTYARQRLYLSTEVDALLKRTSELESGLASLTREASALPVRISRLQQHLAILQILVQALNGSLRQLQTALSFSRMKDFSARRIEKTIRDLRDRYLRKDG